MCVHCSTGSTSNDVLASASDQSSDSLLPAEPSTSSTTTSTTISVTPDYRIEFDVISTHTSLSDARDHPLTDSFDPATRQRPRPSTTRSTPMPPPRRRWPPRRGRYPPSRNRYGRRPPFRSTATRRPVSATMTVLVVLAAYRSVNC